MKKKRKEEHSLYEERETVGIWGFGQDEENCGKCAKRGEN